MQRLLNYLPSIWRCTSCIGVAKVVGCIYATHNLLVGCIGGAPRIGWGYNPNQPGVRRSSAPPIRHLHTPPVGWGYNPNQPGVRRSSAPPILRVSP